MDGFDQLINLPPEIRETLTSGAVSFAVNVLSNDHLERRARLRDERLKHLKFDMFPGDYDIERGVRKAQLWATYKVARDDYAFANMPSLDEGEVKELLPGVSIRGDALGWRLKLTTLAELKQRFGSEQAFDTLQRLLLGGWQKNESSFDWFSTFSAHFAQQRKDDSDLRAAFDGHVLTEIANRLELSYEGLHAKLDELLERSKSQAWSLPNEALHPDAPHLPRIEAPFVFSLSLGVEVTGRPNEEDKHRIPYEALNYSEDSSIYRGRHREPRPASQVLNEWLRQPGVHVVTGEPGGGKTTLLSHWAKTLQQDYLEDNRRAFPLYVPLREIRNTSRGALLSKGVQSYFEREGLWGYRLDINPYRSGERRAVWLLDGWDELDPSQKKHWQDIVRSLKGVVVISCRVAQYQNEFGRDHLIMGLGKKEQAQFLERLTSSLQ